MRRPTTPRTRALAAALFALAAASPAGTARADDEPGEPRFYKGYDYGTQALYGPFWVIANRGFDVVQIRTERRAILSSSYGAGARNVADNLLHPVGYVDGEGRAQFVREEILPLSWTQSTARWIPNYTLHLIGGGTTYATLREWGRAQGIDDPWAAMLAATTILTSAFVNETLENGGVVGRNTDAIADWYFFDLGGILLFSFEPAQRFFSKTLIVSDWSLQPSFTFPNGELHDIGNYYAAKLPVPYLERLRIFGYYGLGTLGGLSWKLDRQHSISAAFGSKVTRLVNRGHGEVANTISYAPSGAIFFDRNESLLASVQVSDVRDYFVQLNLYPNAFVRTDPGVGLWTVAGRDGRFAAGVSITRAFGLGAGWSGL